MVCCHPLLHFMNNDSFGVLPLASCKAVRDRAVRRGQRPGLAYSHCLLEALLKCLLPPASCLLLPLPPRVPASWSASKAVRERALPIDRYRFLRYDASLQNAAGE